MSDDQGGPSLEAVTTMASLAHHVRGKWLGHAVLSNTFRHPAVLAKQATVLDHISGGRFILGLGAGWHEFEHRSFGIPLPPIGERIDRLGSALAAIKALFSPAAAHPPGVSLADPFYPLDRATNEPPPLRPGGPPIWLGGQKPRGIALAARYADGWLVPGINAGDVAYFTTKRDEIRAALDAAGRGPAAFVFAAQVNCGTTADQRRQALDQAIALRRAGAGHVILQVAPGEGRDGLVAIAREVAEPLREAAG